MRLHRDVQSTSQCGGQVADGGLFNTDYWCVYCGAKFNDPLRIGDRVSLPVEPGESTDFGVIEYWDDGWYVRLDSGELTGGWDSDELGMR